MYLCKKQVTAKNLFSYTLLFQNSHHMMWYICPISPSTSPVFWPTRSNRWNWSENSPLQQLLHWCWMSIPEAQILGTERAIRRMEEGQGDKGDAPWPRSRASWETLSSYCRYVDAHYPGEGWISSLIPVFFLVVCVNKVFEPHNNIQNWWFIFVLD